MEDLLALFADLLPGSIAQDLVDAMPGWLRGVIVAGCVAAVGYMFWAFLR